MADKQRIKELENELRLLRLVNQRQRQALKNLIKALNAQGGYS